MNRSRQFYIDYERGQQVSGQLTILQGENGKPPPTRPVGSKQCRVLVRDLRFISLVESLDRYRPETGEPFEMKKRKYSMWGNP